MTCDSCEMVRLAERAARMSLQGTPQLATAAQRRLVARIRDCGNCAEVAVTMLYVMSGQEPPRRPESSARNRALKGFGFTVFTLPADSCAATVAWIAGEHVPKAEWWVWRIRHQPMPGRFAGRNPLSVPLGVPRVEALDIDGRGLIWILVTAQERARFRWAIERLKLIAGEIARMLVRLKPEWRWIGYRVPRPRTAAKRERR